MYSGLPGQTALQVVSALRYMLHVVATPGCPGLVLHMAFTCTVCSSGAELAEAGAACGAVQFGQPPCAVQLLLCSDSVAPSTHLATLRCIHADWVPD